MPNLQATNGAGAALSRAAATTAVLVLLCVGGASAQAADQRAAARDERVFRPAGEPAVSAIEQDELLVPDPSPAKDATGVTSDVPRLRVRYSVTPPIDGPFRISEGTRSWALQSPSAGPQRSLARKIAGGVLGAVLGFYGGGFLGGALERPCDCDDPGLVGFLIGAPIGAVGGAILGAKFF